MKNLYFLIASCLSLTLCAQHETIFDDLDVIGGFGGPILEIGSINDEIGADVGGGGALILNNFFVGGYGMGTDYPDFTIDEGEFEGDYNLKFGHGGLWLGYNHRPYKLAHLFFSTKIGWGKARMRGGNDMEFKDRVFVLLPELGIEFNVTDFFKIGLTGGYRWTNGISQLPGLDNQSFSSPVGIINFRFGGFGDWGNWDDDKDDWNDDDDDGDDWW